MLVNALLIDIALNPRYPTFTAWHIACQPFTQHCSTSGSYLAIFLSCVDSMFFPTEPKVPRLSLSLWNLKTLLYLIGALSPQYVLEPSSAFPGPPTITILALITAFLYFLSEAVSSFPLLTKLILCLPGLNLFDFIASDTASAIALRTWQCRQR